jgi:hypothetical protein
MLSLLLNMLSFNPAKNKNEFCRTFIVLINTNIAAKLLGKSKLVIKRYNAFYKILQEKQI